MGHHTTAIRQGTFPTRFFSHVPANTIVTTPDGRPPEDGTPVRSAHLGLYANPRLPGATFARSAHLWYDVRR